MRRGFYFLIFSLIISAAVKAQQGGGISAQQELVRLQDSLKRFGYQVVNNPSEPERYNASYKMIRTLVSALRLNNSFNFSFDSLKTISIQTSPDSRFRIFSWHVLNNDGSYRYYGTIQMNSPGKLQMYPLVDHSPRITSPADSVLSSERWYGAQYYRIIPVTSNVQTPYYILLGWKGHSVKSTKRVIDILYFKGGKAWFGMPVFEGNKEWGGKRRIIFEYSRQTSMMLNYIPKEGIIAFDHLVPPNPEMKSSHETYGPDLSYDGLKLDRGRLKFIENITLKNAPSAIDNLYVDPTKPSKETINKLK